MVLAQLYGGKVEEELWGSVPRRCWVGQMLHIISSISLIYAEDAGAYKLLWNTDSGWCRCNNLTIVQAETERSQPPLWRGALASKRLLIGCHLTFPCFLCITVLLLYKYNWIKLVFATIIHGVMYFLERRDFPLAVFPNKSYFFRVFLIVTSSNPDGVTLVEQETVGM